MSANHPPSALIGAPPDPKSSPTCPIDTCPPPSDHGVNSEPIAAVVPTGDRASEAPKINENTNNDKKRSQPPRAAAVRYKKKNESAPGHPDRLSTEETVVMTTDQNNSTELMNPSPDIHSGASTTTPTEPLPKPGISRTASSPPSHRAQISPVPTEIDSTLPGEGGRATLSDAGLPQALECEPEKNSNVVTIDPSSNAPEVTLLLNVLPGLYDGRSPPDAKDSSDCVQPDRAGRPILEELQNPLGNVKPQGALASVPQALQRPSQPSSASETPPLSSFPSSSLMPVAGLSAPQQPPHTPPDDPSRYSAAIPSSGDIPTKEGGMSRYST